jgi:hypothetical protein
VVLAVEAGGGASFRIGRALDADGQVTGGWSAWQPIPDWPAEENRGGDIALADLAGDDRRALVVVTVAGTTGESRDRYRVGRGLDADGALAGRWSEWTTIPDWRPDPGHGVGADVGDLDGDGRPDLIVFRVATASRASGGAIRSAGASTPTAARPTAGDRGPTWRAGRRTRRAALPPRWSRARRARVPTS